MSELSLASARGLVTSTMLSETLSLCRSMEKYSPIRLTLWKIQMDLKERQRHGEWEGKKERDSLSVTKTEKKRERGGGERES